jgi:type II secretory ATPase GspE/PulE/Tfp pilus assembly ATPase PilB-like protein
MNESTGKQLIRIIKNQAAKQTKGKFSADRAYKPQDAKIVYEKLGPHRVDVRLSFVPSGLLDDNESVVARILVSKTIEAANIVSLGYDKAFAETMNNIAWTKGGLVVISGITGSGKSTLLANIIAGIDASKKIVTAEDPIEYRISRPNIEQHQIYEPPVENEAERAEKTMGFRELAKAFKRGDPDIVVIGETRKDPSLLEALFEMAEAGQLVFTTIHIVSAFALYRALGEVFGLDQAVTAPVVKTSVNQALTKKLCPHCKVPDVAGKNKKWVEEILPDVRYGVVDFAKEFLDSNTPTYVKGEGCAHCSGTGLLGRTPIYEYFVPDAKLKDEIASERLSPFQIENRVYEMGRGRNKFDVFIEKLKNGEIDADPKFARAILA